MVAAAGRRAHWARKVPRISWEPQFLPPALPTPSKTTQSPQMSLPGGCSLGDTGAPKAGQCFGGRCMVPGQKQPRIWAPQHKPLRDGHVLRDVSGDFFFLFCSPQEPGWRGWLVSGGSQGPLLFSRPRQWRETSPHSAARLQHLPWGDQAFQRGQKRVQSGAAVPSQPQAVSPTGCSPRLETKLDLRPASLKPPHPPAPVRSSAPQSSAPRPRPTPPAPLQGPPLAQKNCRDSRSPPPPNPGGPHPPPGPSSPPHSSCAPGSPLLSTCSTFHPSHPRPAPPSPASPNPPL